MNPDYNIVEIKGKKFKKSRLLMEEFLGRKLESDEVVHHINGNKKDDRIQNLEVMDEREHQSLHHAGIKRGAAWSDVQ